VELELPDNEYFHEGVVELAMDIVADCKQVVETVYGINVVPGGADGDPHYQTQASDTDAMKETFVQAVKRVPQSAVRLVEMSHQFIRENAAFYLDDARYLVRAFILCGFYLFHFGARIIYYLLFIIYYLLFIILCGRLTIYYLIDSIYARLESLLHSHSTTGRMGRDGLVRWCMPAGLVQAAAVQHEGGEGERVAAPASRHCIGVEDQISSHHRQDTGPA